jgi:hypothetical protein
MKTSPMLICMMCTDIFCGIRVIPGYGLNFCVARVSALTVDQGGKVLG